MFSCLFVTHRGTKVQAVKCYVACNKREACEGVMRGYLLLKAAESTVLQHFQLVLRRLQQERGVRGCRAWVSLVEGSGEHSSAAHPVRLSGVKKAEAGFAFFLFFQFSVTHK